MSHALQTAKKIVWGIDAVLAALLLPAGIGAAQPGVPPAPPPIVTPLRAYGDGLHAPARIATDLLGRVYITDSTAGRVIVRDEYGQLRGLKPGLARPLGIAVDAAGFVYVGEESRGSVSVFDANWGLVRKLGAGDGEFLLPNHVAVDPGPPGSIYVTDSRANLVKVYAPSGQPIGLFGGAGTLDGQFQFPTGVVVTAAGEVYVADQNNQRIQVFTRAGVFLRRIRLTSGMLGTGAGRVQGMTADLIGRLYVADAFQGVVRVLGPDGTKLSQVGSFGTGPGALQNPSGLVIDRNNRLLVVSAGNARVELFGLDSFVDPTVVPATVAFRPATLSREGDDHGVHGNRDEGGGARAREGPWVTGLLKVPGYAPADIDLRSVRANGIPAEPARGAQIADFDEDGALELRFRVDRAALLGTLQDGEAIVTVTGTLAGGATFEATTRVRVVPGEERGGGEPAGQAPDVAPGGAR